MMTTVDSMRGFCFAMGRKVAVGQVLDYGMNQG